MSVLCQYKKNLVSIFLAMSALLLGAWANPMKAIEPEIEKFKQDHPNQIQVLAGKNQPIRYAWTGDPIKRPLLFVHGSPGSWGAWIGFLDNTELQKNFQLIAVDRPGYGGSQEGVSQGSLQLQAADIIEVLKINQSHLPAILIGHSFGGPVIARIAMDDPDQVAGLIFVAASVDPELESTKWYQYPANWWPFKFLIPDTLRVCNEEILKLKPELTQMLPLWKSIQAKTIVIQGNEDELVPPANADFIEKHLSPEALVKIVRVPGLNHFVPWKRPDLILEGIQQLDLALSTNKD